MCDEIANRRARKTRPSAARPMVTMAMLFAVALAAVLVVPVLAAARGVGGSGGRGGPSLSSGRGHVNGCKHKRLSRIPQHTTKRMHQGFLEYSGELTAPGGSQAPWAMLIDRCATAPKVTYVTGEIPAYKCPDGSGAFGGFNDVGRSFLGHELAIQGGNFSVSGVSLGLGDGDTYSLTGTVTGKVKIPKHGKGKGSSTITGKLTDESFCSSNPLTYKVKFIRTWAYVGAGEGS
jgi:hypothetical protein